jgi:hypothetical protein
MSEDIWTADLLGEPLGIDRESRGDAWQERLTKRILETTGATGLNASLDASLEPRRLVMTVTESSLDSELHLFPVDHGGFYLMVQGTGAASEDQVDPWRNAAIAARDDVSLPIGPCRGSRLSVPTPRIQDFGSGSTEVCNWVRLRLSLRARRWSSACHRSQLQ